ncbi:putative F-box protein At4g22660 [Apium graveolens]|uniref:putative F-box protein At4g22660 n=1 Tax=Apium graveolens TaxID=4045 RepID=UPI003D7B4324
MKNVVVEKETEQEGVSSNNEEFGRSGALTSSPTGFFDLPEDMSDKILLKMSLISILNFKTVCRSSRNVVRSFVSSSSNSQVHLVPWILLPRKLEDKRRIGFSTYDDQMVFMRTNAPPEFYDGLCLGTSHGWLVMLDKDIEPYLFNPFSFEKITLPEIFTFPNIQCLFGSVGSGYYIHYYENPYKHRRRIKSVQELRTKFVSKAVVSANPSHNNGNFFVLMISAWRKTGAILAFCYSGDDVWMQLGDHDESYCDVICHDDMFYALNYPDEIEIWDVHNGYPTKRTSIVAKYPQKVFDTKRSLKFRDCDTTRSYLVEVSGDLFLVVRFIGGLVRSHETSKFELRHETLCFQVYKLDTSIKKWEEVESLGDLVYFVGGNQSKSLLVPDNSAYKANSIYFTDDYWDMMYWRKNHYDIGVYHMEDKSIEKTLRFDWQNEPPPFWIDPESLVH